MQNLAIFAVFAITIVALVALGIPRLHAKLGTHGAEINTDLEPRLKHKPKKNCKRLVNRRCGWSGIRAIDGLLKPGWGKSPVSSCGEAIQLAG